MGQVHRLKALRKNAPVQLPESFLRVRDVLGLPPVGRFTEFSLQRTRGGTIAHLHAGGFSMAVSALEGVSLPNFRAARQWIAAFAERHGLELTERKLRP